VSKNLIDKLGFTFGNDGQIFSLATDLGKKGLAFPFKSGTFKTSGTNLLAANNTAGYLDFGTGLSVAFNMLKTDTTTKLLARPRILTLNNETAEIGITKDVVVSRSKSSDTDTGVDTYTYERSSSLTLTPEGIGVFLRVTPMINEETGEIILVVNPKSSSVTHSEVAVAPDINLDPEVRASKSIIKIKDGETVVIGGLIKMDKNVSKSKMPILGDIPVLGMAFRNRDQSINEERELLVFITPHIMYDSASPLSSKKKAALPTAVNRQRSQANKVTLFTRHEAVNTALNNLDSR
jgi:general secretion pathway protein D